MFMGNKNFNIKPRLSAPSWLHVTATSHRWPPPPLHALSALLPPAPSLPFYSILTQHSAQGSLVLIQPLSTITKKKKK